MLGHYQILTVSDHGCNAWIGQSRNSTAVCCVFLFSALHLLAFCQHINGRCQTLMTLFVLHLQIVLLACTQPCHLAWLLNIGRQSIGNLWVQLTALPQLHSWCLCQIRWSGCVNLVISLQRVAQCSPHIWPALSLNGQMWKQSLTKWITMLLRLRLVQTLQSWPKTVDC